MKKILNFFLTGKLENLPVSVSFNQTNERNIYYYYYLLFYLLRPKKLNNILQISLEVAPKKINLCIIFQNISEKHAI